MPGFRALDKYAVRCRRGAQPPRRAVRRLLVKDNHLAQRRRSRSWPRSFGRRRAAAPKTRARSIEVEVDTLEQLREVLKVDGIDVDPARQHGLPAACSRPSSCATSRQRKGKVELGGLGRRDAGNRPLDRADRRRPHRRRRDHRTRRRRWTSASTSKCRRRVESSNDAFSDAPTDNPSAYPPPTSGTIWTRRARRIVHLPDRTGPRVERGPADRGSLTRAKPPRGGAAEARSRKPGSSRGLSRASHGARRCAKRPVRSVHGAGCVAARDGSRALPKGCSW